MSIDKSLSELLQVEGVSADEARTGFQQVAQQRELTSGRGDVVSQEQLIRGGMLQDAESQKAIERAGMARAGRFQGGGGFVGSNEGMGGLRGAAT